MSIRGIGMDKSQKFVDKNVVKSGFCGQKTWPIREKIDGHFDEKTVNWTKKVGIWPKIFKKWAAKNRWYY